MQLGPWINAYYALLFACQGCCLLFHFYFHTAHCDSVLQMWWVVDDHPNAMGQQMKSPQHAHRLTNAVQGSKLAAVLIRRPVPPTPVPWIPPAPPPLPPWAAGWTPPARRALATTTLGGA